MKIDTFFKKAVPDRKDTDAPRQPRAVFYKGGRPVIVYDNYVTGAAALKHPVTQRCLRMIARAVQVVSWYAELDPDVSGGKKGDVNKLNDLLKSPNGQFTAANMRYWMALTLGVYGRVPFKVSRSTISTLANGLYPLDAALMKTVVDNSGRIKEFKYGDASQEETFRSKRTALEPDGAYAYIIGTPGLSANPAKIEDCINPLSSLGLIMKTLDALMLRTLATAQGHPNAKYIVSTEATITNEQQVEIEEYIEEAETDGDRSGEVMVLNGAKVNVTKLDADMSDIHSKMPMDDLTRVIFGAFGIPIALAGLGAADGAKYASNFSESRASFYMDTIIPEYLSPLADGLTDAIAPQGVRIRFDIDSIPALLGQRLAAAQSLKDVSYLSDDEKRELLGFAPRGS